MPVNDAGPWVVTRDSAVPARTEPGNESAGGLRQPSVLMLAPSRAAG